jgi:hypothetical protein
MTRPLRHAWLFGLLASWCVAAQAQPVPVTVNVVGNVATVRVGALSKPLAEVTLEFDQATGLTPASLGVSAETVNIAAPALVARMPSPTLTKMSSALPLMITIEPPSGGGLVQRRVTHIDLHTHALAYTAGSPLRLFKAPLAGNFRDITGEVAPGSVRTRGTTPGWSQFVILADLRPTGDVIEEKYTYLRTQLDLLPAAEKPPLAAMLDASESNLAAGNFAGAIERLDAFRARVSARAGSAIPDVWRATRDVTNNAGELLAGADTLGFSIGYLRDFGH